MDKDDFIAKNHAALITAEQDALWKQWYGGHHPHDFEDCDALAPGGQCAECLKIAEDANS